MPHSHTGFSLLCHGFNGVNIEVAGFYFHTKINSFSTIGQFTSWCWEKKKFDFITPSKQAEILRQSYKKEEKKNKTTILFQELTQCQRRKDISGGLRVFNADHQFRIVSSTLRITIH